MNFTQDWLLVEIICDMTSHLEVVNSKVIIVTIVPKSILSFSISIIS